MIVTKRAPLLYAPENSTVGWWVRNVEALDAGGSPFKRGGGSGAGDPEGGDGRLQRAS